jgi:hypothetical protein
MIKLTTPPPEHPAPAPAAAPAVKSAPATSVPQAHKDAQYQAELARQTAITAMTPQATAKAADIAYHRAILQSALANGVSPSASIRALQSLGVTGL